jgi:hypothetical protein
MTCLLYFGIPLKDVSDGTGEATTTFLAGDDLVFDFSLDPPCTIQRSRSYRWPHTQRC